MDSAKKMDSIKNHHSRRRLVDDLLLEILSRVPAKSLIRFKCVSKAWCSLTSDLCYQKSLPSTMHGFFYQAYTRSNSQRFKWSINYFPIVDDRMIETTLSLSFLTFSDKLSIIDSCNGLLLCSSGAIPEIFYVCNPVTKKYLALPKPHKRRIRICPMLAFDPRVSPHFRVIDFYRTESSVEVVLVFSSETGEWVEREMCWEPHIKPSSHRQRVFLGRSLYLVASSKLTIVGYNLEEHSCRSFQLPEPAPTSNKRCLGQSGGYLHFVHKDKDQLRIWMLKDYDSNGWVLKHRMNVQEIVEQHNFPVPITSDALYFFAFHPESDDLFLWLGGSLYSYNFASSKLEEACRRQWPPPCCTPFSPCLIEWD